MWNQCLIIAVTIWFAAIIAAGVTAKLKYKSKRILTPTNIMFVGTVASALVLFLPIYAQEFRGDSVFLRIFKTLFLSLHHVIRLFVIDSDFSVIQESADNFAPAFSAAYSLFASVLFICAPLLTFGFVLSFFKNISSYKRYIANFFKDVCVFSELNEKSLALAESISENHKAKNQKVLTVFTDVFEKNDEVSYELIEKARELGAICFKKDVLSVNFKLHSKRREIKFFAIGADESENIKQSLGILKAYRSRENTKLFVFSTAVDGELTMTSANKGGVEVHRVNDIRSLVYRTLYDMEMEAIDRHTAAKKNPKAEKISEEEKKKREKKDIFESAMQITEIEKEIGAVIVGMGAHGTEMLKTLTWFCQMDGYRVTLNAFDKDELAESKFTALCPELMDEKFNGKYIEKEAQYLINIHSGIDVDSLEFTEKIKKLPNTTYVFVAIGGDSDNIRCAVNLRTLFVRMGIHPIIHAVVYDSDKKEALVGVENFKKQAYDIDFVGDLKSIYSEEVIINSELEHIALRGHMKRAEDKIRDDEAAAKKKSTPEDFAEKLLEAKNELFTFEYNYRSSIASALHIKARRACEIPGTDKKIDDMSEAEKEGIKILEHRRWNAYMRSEGFIFSGSTESDTRNDLGKMHNDLTDFDKLNAKEKEKDLRV